MHMVCVWVGLCVGVVWGGGCEYLCVCVCACTCVHVCVVLMCGCVRGGHKARSRQLLLLYLCR